MPSPPILDQESIANLRALSPDDGDVFLREIVGIFLEDTPVRIAELHSGQAKGDVASFSRAAHSVKGSSSNLGAMELRAVAERLEHMAKQSGFAGVDPVIVELESAFARVGSRVAQADGLIAGLR